jgi:hypothetical protein
VIFSDKIGSIKVALETGTPDELIERSKTEIDICVAIVL